MAYDVWTLTCLFRSAMFIDLVSGIAHGRLECYSTPKSLISVLAEGRFWNVV